MKKAFSWIIITCVALAIGSSAAMAGTVKWKWAHYQPVDSLVDRMTKAMAGEIEEKTKGAIKITIYPANQLGDWMEVSEQIMRGAVDIGILPVSPSYDARLQVRVLPYSVMNWDEAKAAYLGEDPYLFNIMSGAMDSIGLKALSVVAAGFGGGGFASVPEFDVLDPEADKQGYKMRFPPGNQAWENLVLALGFNPTPVPWGELYIAQQTKLVDCQIGGQPYNTWSSFRDVTKVWVQYNTHFQNSFAYMNKKSWEKLTPEQQKIVTDAARKYGNESFVTAMAEDQQFRDKLAGAGIRVIQPDDAQLEVLAKKVRTTVWPAMDKVIGKDIMDVMRQKAGL
ncbi:MAG: TRAP transporter substrate-binding protein DctP [Desulfobacterales bacterium]|nr:TRAP transporter substrate-binding protein DctP [Desulfobacterales bacterium]